MSSPPSSQTVQNDSQATEAPPLDLSELPPIFVSATHFAQDDLHRLEDDLGAAGACLTYDVSEARIVLTKVLSKKRIAIDLRSKGLWTEEVIVSAAGSNADHADVFERSRKDEGRPAKRQKVDSGHSQLAAIVIDDDQIYSDDETASLTKKQHNLSVSIAQIKSQDGNINGPNGIIKVVRLQWFEDSQKAGYIKSLHDYIVYTCRDVGKPVSSSLEPASPAKRNTKTTSATTPTKVASSDLGSSPSSRTAILDRAKEDATQSTSHTTDRFGKRRFGHQQAPTTEATWAAGHHIKNKAAYAHLLTKTTTEDEQGYSSDLPEMPNWVKQGVKYSCQRQSPLSCPNEDFMGLLKKIRLARTLTNDEIGVRAYSTSIASLAAYPCKLCNPREILALPGCDAKIANLFVEFENTGAIAAVADLESDEDLKILRLFYEIWGVGAKTAREFYFDRGWKDLDDIVEYGWSTLSRVQQIGVKYYDEFLDLIPRQEVEEIARIIHRHAVLVRDDGIQSILVGGYRKGKAACGDVDIVVSHPDEHQTLNLINDIVASLEEEGWVTHTLLLAMTNSKRDQETLPYKSREGPSGSYGGFDSLDKALVVWQDPAWPAKASDEAHATSTGERLRNPNIHRRVDIIIAPWRTVGCAVAGWSGGTTFERDLRRYAKNVRGWKFDSSGVRDRVHGEVLDIEGFYKNGVKGRARTMVEAERRVFEGMGLPFIEPSMRNTG
ncbi:hypothetical protein LTR78_004043 [Recurvomyces mirabilis]|uniref:DNA-directed DNA polymerase n=1 Tax=Recurvomyces mirabilis TaxID=574656 RepID=A0AAE0WQS9_9PEZI|nr:hypothetical protein LTR78_004043 [Recurvomyces mirabilis]KAK5153819.1 hypothetical protein LTS14_007038 [Recurvomyces mirabilis]